MRKEISGTILALLLIGMSMSGINVQADRVLLEEAEFLPILPVPPSPPPNYTWVDTGGSLLYAVYGGVNYSTGLALGLHLPETIELNKKYPIYIYTTRIFEPENITVPLDSPFSIKICLGIGIETPPFKWCMHIGFGFGFLSWEFWDRWTWHIQLPLPLLLNLTLAISYPNITYANILEIPLNKWDGPYKAEFTLTGGYIQMETIIVKFENVSYGLNILTNSMISNFVFDQPMKSISFNVSGDPKMLGFCNVTIPKTLMSGPWQVRIDNNSIPFKEMENVTHSFLYFTYNHSAKTVQIIGTYVIPEFPTWLPPWSILQILSLLILVAAKAKRKTIQETIPL